MSLSGDAPSNPDLVQPRNESWSTSEAPPWAEKAIRTTAQLRTLSPTFSRSKHQVYLDVLEAAVTHPLNQSIALSGTYGSGKSSVLSEFTRLHSTLTVEISFSGLRADLPQVSTAATGSNPAAGTKTNQIQKEIVKQLLYTERPAAMPGSRYRRPETFQRRRELAIASLFGAILATAALLAGLLERAIATVGGGPGSLVIVVMIAAVLAGAAVLGLRRLFHNRVIIEKLSAGSTSIALSSQASSYFDEYIDEIVYFFQASKRRFVIFEDLDRFDDYEIFQSLGALNVLLNRSAQIDDKPIVFIYAVRDSIFEDVNSTETDTARAELERANRTKFFDLVIPMVPFVSNRNARDLMLEEATGRDIEISPELIDLAARHVADMRLIRNILNEFALFHKVLIENKTGVPGLSSDQLFALILYKNVHLADFERIGRGKSSLDAAYDVYREFINAASTAAISKISKLGIEAASSSTRSRRAQEFGTAVRNYLRLTSAAFGIAHANRLVLDGVELADSGLDSVEVWKSISERQLGLDVILAYRSSNQPLTLSFEVLIEIVGNSLTEGEWKEVDTAAAAAELEEAKSETRDIAYLSMADLHDRPDLTLESAPGVHESFEQAVAPVLHSDLGRDLLREGYIDEYFALYAAQYHSQRVSANAMNFIIRRVDRGLSDPLYELSGAEAESVLRERPELVRTQSVCNIRLLDYILANGVGVSPAINQAANDEEFLGLYFTFGDATDELVSHLSRHWVGSLRFLASIRTDTDSKLQLMQRATDNISADLDYVSDTALTRFIVENADALPFLSGDEATPAALKLLNNLRPNFAYLGAVGTAVREFAIQNRLYLLNEANLALAVGQKEISLDHLQAVEAVFDRATASIVDYLDIQSRSPVTPFAVRQGATLARVLNKVTTSSEIEAVILRSAPSAKVASLATVPELAWPILARTKRFPPSAANLHLYVSKLGLDHHAEALVRGRQNVDEVTGASEAERMVLIDAILGATSIAPVTRARITRRLLAGKTLAASRVPLLEGGLFGQLVRAGVLMDDLTTFEATKTLSWATREAVIAQSKMFKTYLTPTLLTSVELTRFIGSEVINPSIKMVIFDDFAGYVEARQASVYAVANLARDQKRMLSTAQIESLVKRGLNPAWTLRSLHRGLERRPVERVEAVLAGLGKKYAKLTTHSRSKPNFPNDVWHQTIVDFLIPHGKVKGRSVAYWDSKKMVVQMH
jgi:hypothetical protein